MKSHALKRTYLNHSNQQLSEILFHSPYIKVSGQSPERQKLQRLPLNLKQEREAYAHGQMLTELVHRLGSPAVADRMVLCAAYDHLHYRYGTYILHICEVDHVKVVVTDPIDGIPVVLAKQYTEEFIEEQSNGQDCLGWTLSVLLEDGTTEIYISLLDDLLKLTKQSLP